MKTTLKKAKPHTSDLGIHILDIKAVHPKNATKFSPNLYKFLASGKNPSASQYQVFKDENGTLWIGRLDAEEGWFTGCRLMQALTIGSAATNGSFGLKQFKSFTLIEDFWQKYLEDGRCAIDPAHVVHFIDETRWSCKKGTRECLWCGKSRQKQETYKVTETRTRWVPIQKAGK